MRLTKNFRLAQSPRWWPLRSIGRLAGRSAGRCLCIMPFAAKAPEDWSTPRRCAFMRIVEPRGSVVECGGPPPLFPIPPRNSTKSFPIPVSRHSNRASIPLTTSRRPWPRPADMLLSYGCQEPVCSRLRRARATTRAFKVTGITQTSINKKL